MVCVGDMGGCRTLLGRWRPPCADLPGPWHAVLGNHDFTRILGREKALGTGTASMTLVIRSDPPLLVTHVPMAEVPDGCVNVHGHEHAFKPLRRGGGSTSASSRRSTARSTCGRRSSPLRRSSSRAGYPRGSRRPNGCGTSNSQASDETGGHPKAGRGAAPAALQRTVQAREGQAQDATPVTKPT